MRRAWEKSASASARVSWGREGKRDGVGLEVGVCESVVLQRTYAL